MSCWWQVIDAVCGVFRAAGVPVDWDRFDDLRNDALDMQEVQFGHIESILRLEERRTPLLICYTVTCFCIKDQVLLEGPSHDG